MTSARAERAAWIGAGDSGPAPSREPKRVLREEELASQEMAREPRAENKGVKTKAILEGEEEEEEEEEES